MDTFHFHMCLYCSITRKAKDNTFEHQKTGLTNGQIYKYYALLCNVVMYFKIFKRVYKQIKLFISQSDTCP